MYNAACNSLVVLALLVVSTASGMAADGSPSDGAEKAPGATSDSTEFRALGGTSVIGNRELPKSLYIVPWKNSEVGVQTDLSRDLLDEGVTPVDPIEFRRQVNYYEFNQQK